MRVLRGPSAASGLCQHLREPGLPRGEHAWRVPSSTHARSGMFRHSSNTCAARSRPSAGTSTSTSYAAAARTAKPTLPRSMSVSTAPRAGP